jgi:hypothetical protein
MHEYLAAVVTGEKAIPLIGVVPLDLAGRHRRPHVERTKDNQRSGDRQDAWAFLRLSVRDAGSQLR